MAIPEPGEVFLGRGKWKQRLLGTGLPMESEVAHTLNRLNFMVMGEYEYHRPTFTRESETFSVDVHAFDLMDDPIHGHWAESHLLVECKYHTEGTMWVFSPHPSHAGLLPWATSTLDHLTTRVVLDSSPLDDHEAPLSHCMRGDLLWENRGGDNRTKHGLHQLWYAMPNLALQILDIQAETDNEAELRMAYVCPVLVTNAELFILNHDAGVEKTRQAQNLQEVASPVNCLVVDRRPSPALRSYCAELFDNGIARSTLAEQRYEAVQSAAARYRERMIQPFSLLSYEISEMCRRVLVIRLAYFETWVKEHQSAIKICARGVKRVARLVRDDERGRARAAPLDLKPTS